MKNRALMGPVCLLYTDVPEYLELFSYADRAD